MAVVGLLVVLLLLTGCRGTQFRGRGLDQYPAQGEWQYTAILYVETPDSGSMYDPQNKDIFIRIEDRAGNRLLDDRLERRRACLIEGDASWPVFGEFEVVIREEGDADSKNQVSRALAASGPRTLFTLKYRYNQKAGKFERVKP